MVASISPQIPLISRFILREAWSRNELLLGPTASTGFSVVNSLACRALPREVPHPFHDDSNQPADTIGAHCPSITMWPDLTILLRSYNR